MLLCKRALFLDKYAPARSAAVLVDIFSDMFLSPYSSLPSGFLAEWIAHETGYERDDSLL
jgi:hypothetical protein